MAMIAEKGALRIADGGRDVYYDNISHLDLVNNDDIVTAAIVEKSGEISRVKDDSVIFVWAREEEFQVMGAKLIEKLQSKTSARTISNSAEKFFESLCP